MYGNLGLFIGAGFSKAVLNESPLEIALSWGDLLKKAAIEIGVDIAPLLTKGASFPAIASRLCRVLAAQRHINYLEACVELKETIARITAWYANQDQRNRIGAAIEEIKPAWIVTTNYDLVIESLLPGKCITFGPLDVPSAPAGRIPVYHLHGMRSDPTSLVVTEEDYVKIFRPSEYRQTKLAILLKEAVTLVVGYGLGDVNVLTAIDWIHNVFGELGGAYPRGIVQLVREKVPSPPTIQEGLATVGTPDIQGFFDELLTMVRHERAKQEQHDQWVIKIASLLSDETNGVAESFVDKKVRRAVVLNAFEQGGDDLAPVFLSFLKRVLDLTWKRAEPNGAFHAYNEALNVVLDLLVVIDPSRSPAVFHELADALSRLSPYIGYNAGQSWAAGKTWDERKSEIPAVVVEGLQSYTVSNVANLALGVLLQ